MNLPVKKGAPTLAVLAVLAHCCWPDAEGPDTRDMGKDKKGGISQAALAPKGSPLPARDPFQGPARKLPAPAKSAQADGGAAKTPAGGAAKTTASGAAKTVPAEELTRQVASLALKATFLRGERRLALINDGFFSEGELLRSATLKTPWRIAEVYPHRVVLEHQGRRVELTFPTKDGKGPPAAKADQARK